MEGSLEFITKCTFRHSFAVFGHTFRPVEWAFAETNRDKSPEPPGYRIVYIGPSFASRTSSGPSFAYFLNTSARDSPILKFDTSSDRHRCSPHLADNGTLYGVTALLKNRLGPGYRASLEILLEKKVPWICGMKRVVRQNFFSYKFKCIWVNNR